MGAKYILFFVLIIVQTTRATTGNSETMEKKMDSSNCISLLILARSENNQNLNNKAFKYIRQNYEKISSSSEFLDLDISEILRILNNDVAVTFETIVFNSVKRWINHNSTIRIQYLNVLSNLIRFENLPKNILHTESRDFCSENSSRQCHARILNALQQKENNNFESAHNNFRDSYSTLMAVGSFYNLNSKTFEIFDLRNNRWIKIENFKCNRTLYSAVLLEDKVMLIGGVNTGIAVNTVQSYDLNTGTMENLPPMKYARRQLSAVEFKGCVYAIGGNDGKKYLLYIEMWDPVHRIWKELSPMSIPRWGCKVGVLDEEILVVGGYNDNEKWLSDVESYNSATDTWRKRASMNEKRSYLGVAVVGGYLYAVGGITTNYINLNTAERFNPKIDKWTMIHSLNESRDGMGAAYLFGKLVIVGGQNNIKKNVSIMEMYDYEKDKWTSMPSLNDPRLFLNAIEIPWRLAKATLSREFPK